METTQLASTSPDYRQEKLLRVTEPEDKWTIGWKLTAKSNMLQCKQPSCYNNRFATLGGHGSPVNKHRGAKEAIGSVKEDFLKVADNHK